MQKRTLLTGGVALAACAAGAGVAWWRQSRTAPPTAVEAFWASHFDGPNGEPVVMRRFGGRPLLLNFWATWCPPCVQELPLLNAFHAEHAGRGWQVLGLAADQAGPVRQFLQKQPLAFPVGLTGFAGIELSRSLGNLGGSLPFSVLFGRDGAVLHRKTGKLDAGDLAQWAQLA